MFSRFLSGTLVALALSGLASAAGHKYRRSTLDTALYAYGGNISGQSVFYADGLAYIGSTTPSFATVVSNITVATDGMSKTTPWTISSNTTDISGSALYLIPGAGTTPVGFVASNGTAPTGAVTTGFIFFGNTVAYATSDNQLLMQFWAQATNETDLWKLVWNAGGEAFDSAVPVALKSNAPRKPKTM